MGNKNSDPVFTSTSCNNTTSLKRGQSLHLHRDLDKLSLNENTLFNRNFSFRRVNSMRIKPSNYSKLIELKKEIFETIKKANDMDIDKRIKLLHNIKSIITNPFVLKGLIESLETFESVDGIKYSSVMILGEFNILDQYTGTSTFQFVIDLLKSLYVLNNKQQKIIEYAINNDMLYEQIEMIEYIMTNVLDIDNYHFILKGKYVTPLFVELLKNTGINVISNNIIIWNKKYTKNISNLYKAIRLLHSITV
ncbi:hypothetical protein YKV151c [Yokapox virus]|uniref:Protein A47 n=1 Tax=Yokapox virus TaxID=1076255 RepID=G3EI43_9POXV|nr:hypothetical protein YKV151c [Yokapox virus]AEN03740.1 unknown protein [Yokapox virus]